MSWQQSCQHTCRRVPRALLCLSTHHCSLSIYPPELPTFACCPAPPCAAQRARRAVRVLQHVPGLGARRPQEPGESAGGQVVLTVAGTQHPLWGTSASLLFLLVGSFEGPMQADFYSHYCTCGPAHPRSPSYSPSTPGAASFASSSCMTGRLASCTAGGTPTPRSSTW